MNLENLIRHFKDMNEKEFFIFVSIEMLCIEKLLKELLAEIKEIH